MFKAVDTRDRPGSTNPTRTVHRGGHADLSSDIAIHAKEILRVRERLNMIYQRHLTKPHTLDEIGMYYFFLYAVIGLVLLTALQRKSWSVTSSWAPKKRKKWA